MRSDSDSTESRLTLEELVAWNTPQEGSGSVGHDQTLGEGVACDTLEDGRLLYRCQSMTCDRKDHVRRYVNLMPVVYPSQDRFGYTRAVCAEYWTDLNGWRQISSKHEEGADAEAQKRRAGDSATWGLLDRTSNASEVHREMKGSVGGVGRSSHRTRCARTFSAVKTTDGTAFCAQVDHGRPV